MPPKIPRSMSDLWNSVLVFGLGFVVGASTMASPAIGLILAGVFIAIIVWDARQ